jgi:hypothetical protein
MNRARSKKLALLAVAITLWIGVAGMQRLLNRERAALGLTRLTPLENAPPVLAFTTVALGGFRGLIANVLWIRANDLQEEDKHFEMVQLADWITKLEPHFVQVWVVQAWNMVYNISIKFKDPPDRWRWVVRGIELLRDEGLRYNPDETLIYRELAWFFQHKIGQNTDDAHLYYKSTWFAEMNAVLHGRPDYGELLNPQTDEARQRVKLLREKYKMEPRKMKEIDDHYGPLDWRLPETHAIYWANVGLEKARKEDLITLRRVVYQSMQIAFNRGAVITNSFEPGRLVLGPNVDLARNASAAYEEMMEQDPQFRDNIRTAHKNLLRNVPYFLFLNNRQTEAAEWFKKLKQKYPDVVPAGASLEEYVIERVSEIAGETDMDKVAAVISGLLNNSYLELIQGNDNRALNYDRLARVVWSRYQEKTARSQHRVGLPRLEALREGVLQRLMDPEGGLPPEAIARLRTQLRLPAGTNAPPAR